MFVCVCAGRQVCKDSGRVHRLERTGRRRPGGLPEPSLRGVQVADLEWRVQQPEDHAAGQGSAEYGRGHGHRSGVLGHVTRAGGFRARNEHRRERALRGGHVLQTGENGRETGDAGPVGTGRRDQEADVPRGRLAGDP